MIGNLGMSAARAVRRRPYSLVLFDEAESGHVQVAKRILDNHMCMTIYVIIMM